MRLLPLLLVLAAAPHAQTWDIPATQGDPIPADLDGLAERVFLDPAALPAQAWQTVPAVVLEDALLATVASDLEGWIGLPIALAPGVPETLTVTIPGEPAVQALARIARAADVALYRTDQGLVLAPLGWTPPTDTAGPPEAPPAPDLEVSGLEAADGLTLSFAGGDLTTVLPDLQARTGVALTLGPGVSGPLAGQFGPGPAASVLEAALAGNGFALVADVDGGYRVEYAAPTAPTSEGAFDDQPVQSSSAVTVADGLVSLDLTDVPVLEAVRDVATQAGLNVVTHTGADPYGNATQALVSARWTGVPIDEAVGALLHGTPLTAVRQGSLLIIGDRASPAMATTRLLRLEHVPADRALERLPDALRQSTAVNIVEEQNALLVTGPLEAVSQAERFLAEIDEFAPQILMEVLVVEFETSELKELGVTFLGGLLPPGTNLPQTDQPGWSSSLFGGGADAGGGLDYLADAEGARGTINFWADLLGISNIGRLPTDFYLRLQALDRTGRANVRSRPHLVTLNGSPATIAVGTSQYYVLKSAGAGGPVFPGGGAYESERFERVDANVELSVTPWLTGSGEITAELRPTFTTPVGGLDPRQPPTLSTWSVESLVRLREGETIILGGLVQEREGRAENRVPLLGRIPLIGRLFRNSRRTQNKSELVIFITPHVFWGTEDQERGAWEQIERDLGRDAPLLTPEERRRQ